MSNRLSWDEYFMLQAYIASSRSTCNRASVGCLLVRDNKVLSTGYNGSAPGQPHCDEVGHQLVNGHCVRTIHAEQNAISQCALMGKSCKDSIAYITHYPCINCAKLLVASGISKIYYMMDYGVTGEVFDLLRKANVLAIQLNPFDPVQLLKDKVVDRVNRERT